MDHGSWGASHPQTGAVSELGEGPGAGFNVNLPLPLGTGDAGYVRAMVQVVAPVVQEFKPDLVIGAIGQDASQFDPNGRQALSMEGFRALGELLRSIAEDSAGGHLALIQEGGYARTYAAFCLHATLCGVVGLSIGIEDPLAYLPDNSDAFASSLGQAAEALAPYWRSLSP
jgi:acetoin utilization deacetylase AcuC-like enzyme